jgi:hypothetical protein
LQLTIRLKAQKATFRICLTPLTATPRSKCVCDPARGVRGDLERGDPQAQEVV